MEDKILEKDVLTTEAYINKTWPYLKTKLWTPLRDLLPEPENKGLNHIWKYGEADIAVYRSDKLVVVIEPGGSHHMQDDKQKRNDRRKYKLCETNGVSCLHFMNGLQGRLSNRKWRAMLGRVIFG